MKHVRVTLSASGHEADIHPMFDVLVNAPYVDRATALQWNVDEELGILHYVEGDVDAFEAAVDDIEQVIDYTIEPAGDGAFYAYLHDALTDIARGLFDEVTSSGVVAVPPVVYEDGEVRLSVFGPGELVQGSLEAMTPLVEYEVEEIGGLSDLHGVAETCLSDRQRAAVEAAIEAGYYEVPREASHEDVADAIGCSPSTAGEHLRKAEAKLVRAVLGT